MSVTPTKPKDPGLDCGGESPWWLPIFAGVLMGAAAVIFAMLLNPGMFGLEVVS